MSEHTGGDWKIDKWSGGGPPQLEISSDEDIFWIAGVGAPCEDPEMAEANAHLFIAAPKLLAACRLVIKAAGKVDWFLNGAVGKLGVYLSPSELRAIIAAIAKTVGEAQDAS